MKYNFSIGEKPFEVVVGDAKEDMVQVVVNGVPYQVKIDNTPEKPARAVYAPVRPVCAPSTASAPVQTAPAPAGCAPAMGAGVVKAPIPGLVLEVMVKVGDAVQAGQVVATMDAMKMENKLTSAIAGTVKEIFVQKGTEVSTGDKIMTIE